MQTLIDNPEAMAHRIRSERDRLGLSRTAFAGLLGVSHPMLSRYESGDSEPGARVLRRMHAVGVRVDYVLLGDVLPSPPAQAAPTRALCAAEAQLLQHFRAADNDGRRLITLAAQFAAKAKQGQIKTPPIGFQAD